MNGLSNIIKKVSILFIETKQKVKNRRGYADFVFLPISACGTVVQLSAEIDKF